jgi:hypothetical protein
MRRCLIFGLFCLLAVVAVAVPSFAQTETARVSGQITDAAGRSVPKAEVRIVNLATGATSVATTNDDGIYSVIGLIPGRYRITVQKQGFREVIVDGLTLNIQDVVAQNVQLQVGSLSEAVTVTASGVNMNTTDAAVSTVVDRNFIENMPLNGRSFQDLILLTPGIVTVSPQGTSNVLGYTGEFSVNGQRTEANSYSVDGVSANIGVAIGTVQTPAASGSLPASTALGTTQSLVSVDALQEFRVQSSSYSSEYGRNPGGQFSFVTRSGTNDWHGSLFDYLRNDAFDANDWFNNYYDLEKSAERQNDFGGTLGGPIRIPRLYNGKDRTFFFFSYEGLRLIEPQAASVSYVPTAAVRNAAPATLEPIVKAFPLPNCGTTIPNCSNDLGNGLGEFVGGWSNPSSIDAYSVRLDHALSSNEKVFFRFGSTSSRAASREGGAFASPSVEFASKFLTRTYTLGWTSTFSKILTNDLRFNYSSNDATSTQTPTDFADAQAVDLLALQGIPEDAIAGVKVAVLVNGLFPSVFQANYIGKQRVWNLVDGLSQSWGRHQLKFGADYRRLSPAASQFNPFIQYEYLGTSGLDSNRGVAFGETFLPMHPYFQNFSLFAQDEVRVSSRVSLSLGVRWDVNPAPSDSNGRLPYVVQGSSAGTVALAPAGTPLWETDWHSLAPRFGVAYVLQTRPGYETVVRAGGGLFFDTGQQLGGLVYQGPGQSASQFQFSIGGSPVSFPEPLDEVAPVVVNPPVPPYSTAYGFTPNLHLPFTWQTNVSIQQAFGDSQAVTVSYVGAFARKLLEEKELANLDTINPSFTTVILVQNGSTSDYNALQIQYQRRLSHGLQALASYTLSHSIDYGSQNNALPYVRGNSDFDVRHNFSSAISYSLPGDFKNRAASALLHGWALDDRLMARSAFPVTLVGSGYVDPATGQYQYLGLDVVPNQPIYLYGPQFPGNRAINPAAFSNPAAGEVGNAPRNFVRGFGSWQMDVALRREIALRENWKLQFRAEAFNVFNHPNFGTVDSTISDPLFGQATATLAQSLGVLSPLYQMGGPRSMQLALKLMF